VASERFDVGMDVKSQMPKKDNQAVGSNSYCSFSVLFCICGREKVDNRKQPEYYGRDSLKK